MLFVLIALTILTLIYGYVGWRTIRPAPVARRWKGWLWGALAVFWLLAPLPLFLLRFGGEGPETDLLSWAGFLGLGFFTLAFSILLAADVARLAPLTLEKLLRWGAARLQGGGDGSGPTDPARRQVLGFPLNMGLMAVTGTLTGYGLTEAFQQPQWVRVSVPVAGLPAQLDGFTIAQLTDVHVGPTIKEGFVASIVERTNALEPDLIAVTGDLVDGTVPYLKRAVSPLAGLSAAHGVYFVTGNHDYYSGVEPWLEEVTRLGLEVLLNEHRVLAVGGKRLLLAGVTDPQGGTFLPDHAPDVAGALAGAGAADARVLLAHQPVAIFDAAKAGFDLQISGHTHGGQFFPFSVFVDLAQPYLKGLHRHGKTWIYVSQGTGYWGPPMRLGTRPEITLITLTAMKGEA